MEKQKSDKSKHINLGPLLPRVNRVASADPVLKTAAAVIRAAVEEYVSKWEAAHPEAPAHG